MVGLVIAVAGPVLLWWLGGRLANEGRPTPGLRVAPVAGLVALPGVVRWFGRPLAEQLLALLVSVIAWGGVLVAGDWMVLVAFSLIGAVWGLWLAALAVPSEVPAPATTESASADRMAWPPPPPERPPENGQADDQLAFRLAMRCPSCGAEILVPVYHRMARCTYCDSTHMVVGSGHRLVTVIPDSLTGEAAVRDALVRHFQGLRYVRRYDQMVRPLVERHRTEIAESGMEALVAPAAGDPLVNAAEAVVQREAEAYGARIRSRIRIDRWERFLSPYWHRSGTLYQVAFGRDQEGEKRMEFAVTTLEVSLAATSTSLPEMGKLSYLRALRPLHGAPEAMLPALSIDLPETAVEERIEQLSQRRVGLGIQSIARQATLVVEVDAMVYRPWHIVSGELEDDAFALLIEGGGGGVEGDPPAFAALPRPAEPAAEGAATLTPSRCPECGADLGYAPDAVAHVCRNCFRLVALEGTRWRSLPYLREEPPRDTVLLPFWRFPLRIRTLTGELITDLPHLTDGVDGTFDQLGDLPAEEQSFFVPAFRTQVGRTGIRLYRRLWPIVQGWPRTLSGERFSLASAPTRILDVTLPADEARVFARVYLALAFTRRDLARADVRKVRANLLGAGLEGSPDLAFLAIPAALVEPFAAAVGRTPAAAVAALEGRAH